MLAVLSLALRLLMLALASLQSKEMWFAQVGGTKTLRNKIKYQYNCGIRIFELLHCEQRDQVIFYQLVSGALCTTDSPLPKSIMTVIARHVQLS